jgi:predicted phage terminase large subunit-like protein
MPNLTDEEIIELETLLTHRRADELKASLFEFVKEMWFIIVSDKYVHNWHIEYLCDEIQLVLDKYVLGRPPHIEKDKWYEGILDDIKKNLIANVPPGTSKTTILSRMAPAWLWADDASKTLLSNTIDRNNATEFATKSKDIIQSAHFRKFFPDISIRRDVSAKIFYQSNKGGMRYSFTSRGSKTGKHGDVLCDDDPMDYETAQSPILAKACIEGFKALFTRKKNKEICPYILIMQKLSTRDTTAHALKVLEGDVRHICLPAEDTYKNIEPKALEQYYIDGLLDPVRLSRDILLAQKRGLNDDSKPISEIAYNVQFNQASETTDGLMYGKLNKVQHLPGSREGIMRYSFTDVADSGADYLCTWFFEVNQGKIYVFDAVYTQEGSAITPGKMKNKIDFHQSHINKMEVNNQGSVFVTVMQGLGVNVSGYYSSGNKEEKISAFAQFISYIHFVEPGTQPYHTQEYAQAVKHIAAYPKAGKAEDGHDDAEDALTEGMRYLFTNARYLFVPQQNT